MSPKIFTALTLATAAAAGITALALHAPKQVDCACTEEVYVAPIQHNDDYGLHRHRHFARPPAPEPMPEAPMPAPVA